MNFTKHIFLIAISFLGSISSFAQTKKVDVNIVALIKKMSIEEKAGQMTQIDLGVIAEGGICALKNPQTIDLKKIQEAISKYVNINLNDNQFFDEIEIDGKYCPIFDKTSIVNLPIIVLLGIITKSVPSKEGIHLVN
jgi:beta-glucosidase